MEESTAPAAAPSGGGGGGKFRYIVYLVPQGELYALLEQYREETRGLLVNDAHDYLPHCTLTSFFTLREQGGEAEADLLRRLTAALQREISASLDACAEETSSPSSAWAWVEGLYDKDGAIGLAVQAPRIVAAVQRLANEMKSHGMSQGGEGGRNGGVVIVPKTRLHISMAYGDAVTRAKAPELYRLARALEAKRNKARLVDSSPSSWRVELLRQELPQHAKRPEVWMRAPLWSFSPV